MPPSRGPSRYLRSSHEQDLPVRRAKLTIVYRRDTKVFGNEVSLLWMVVVASLEEIQ